MKELRDIFFKGILCVRYAKSAANYVKCLYVYITEMLGAALKTKLK